MRCILVTRLLPYRLCDKRGIPIEYHSWAELPDDSVQLQSPRPGIIELAELRS